MDSVNVSGNGTALGGRLDDLQGDQAWASRSTFNNEVQAQHLIPTSKETCDRITFKTLHGIIKSVPLKPTKSCIDQPYSQLDKTDSYYSDN